MSNPAVITLAETKTSCGIFRVEDNIGEAIHLHLGDIRVDLKIEEFLTLAIDINIVVKKYFENIPGFDLDTISKEFFLQRSDCWNDLERVEHETIKLSNLVVDTESAFGFVKYKDLKNSRILKALKGNSKENDRRMETNYYGKSNQDRVEDILQIMKMEGFDSQKGSLILFNNENNIIDGQHRAACLYHLYGDMEVPIQRFFFRGNKHSVTKYPMLERLFAWKKERIIKLLKKVYGRIKKIVKGMEIKIIGFRVRIDRIRFGNSRG